MNKPSRLRAFLTQEDGATAVEYCVMLAMILLVLIVGLMGAGGGVSAWWANINSDMDANGF